MNPAQPQSNGHPHAHGGGGLSLDDIFYTLFRHQKLILAFVALGVAGAVAARLLHPPPYISNAKLMVRYVAGVNPPAPGEKVITTDAGGQNIISSEVVILTSLDVATNVAAAIGPENILARLGGGDDLMAAAGVICGGLTVEVPSRTPILSISFKHPDKLIVQPVLEKVIDAYIRKHADVYNAGALDELAVRRREDLQQALAKTEEDLRKLMDQAKVVLPEEAKRSYQAQINKWSEELLTAKADLDARKAAMSPDMEATLAASATNGPSTSVPPDTADEFSLLTSQLELKKRSVQEARMMNSLTEAHPVVQRLLAQIQTLNQQRSNLLQRFPALASLSNPAVRTGTNGGGNEIANQFADIQTLTARVLTLQRTLSNIQTQASALMMITPQIEALQLNRDLQMTNIKSLTEMETQAKANESTKVTGINTVQHPTPPGRDMKKFLMLVAGVFGGCAACGLAFAFFIDLVWDRTIRRSADIERHLRLPVFLSIPDTIWKTQGGAAAPKEEAEGGLAPWDPVHHLHKHVEGLRERLMTYFEINNLNLKKPKLVGITGCSSGSGVSTLASSLAATLSQTGDGNVLLVDMNGDAGAAHCFHQGKPGCGLAAVLEPDSRADGKVQDNLYVASLESETNDKLALALPRRFNHLVPKLKASDYDYIIFDMPPVAPTSATPRLASHMDIVLLVLESERTGQQLAKRASALMKESRVNVAAVLNKYRHHVPAQLSPEL